MGVIAKNVEVQFWGRVVACVEQVTLPIGGEAILPLWDNPTIWGYSGTLCQFLAMGKVNQDCSSANAYKQPGKPRLCIEGGDIMIPQVHTLRGRLDP